MIAKLDTIYHKIAPGVLAALVTSIIVWIIFTTNNNDKMNSVILNQLENNNMSINRIYNKVENIEKILLTNHK